MLLGEDTLTPYAKGRRPEVDRDPGGITGLVLHWQDWLKYPQYPTWQESHWSLWGKHCPLNANTDGGRTVAGVRGLHVLPGFVTGCSSAGLHVCLCASESAPWEAAPETVLTALTRANVRLPQLKCCRVRGWRAGMGH